MKSSVINNQVQLVNVSLGNVNLVVLNLFLGNKAITCLTSISHREYTFDYCSLHVIQYSQVESIHFIFMLCCYITNSLITRRVSFVILSKVKILGKSKLSAPWEPDSLLFFLLVAVPQSGESLLIYLALVIYYMLLFYELVGHTQCWSRIVKTYIRQTILFSAANFVFDHYVLQNMTLHYLSDGVIMICINHEKELFYVPLVFILKVSTEQFT